ncbi:MAG: oligosaccharide flippase family protein [Patescibacteria group bacterium]
MENLKNKGLQALHSGERLFKFDMLYLAKGSSWITLSFVVGILGSLVTMVAFGNLLSRETYGTYSYLLSLGASLSFLTLSGAGPAVVRATARGFDNLAHYALTLQLKYNSLSAALILIVAAYYGYKGNGLFAFSLALLSLAYPIADAFHIYKEVLTGRKCFNILSRITNLITVTGAAATVLVLYLTDNILILIALYTIMSFVPNFLVYKSVTKNIKASPKPGEVAEFKRTSLHFTGAGIIGVIASYIDRVILFQAAGPAALAVYTFALAGPDRLKSLIKNTGTIALPRLARRSLIQIHEIVYKRLAILLLSGIALFACYWFLVPLLFKIFLPRYLDAVTYSRVLSLAVIVTPVSVYFGSVFSAQNMIKAMYAFNLTSHIVRIALFIIMGFMWQIWGLVLASVLANVANAVLGLLIWEVEARRLMAKNE